MPKKITKEYALPELIFSFKKKLIKKGGVTSFDLSSHERAREALDFGIKMRATDFNIFVIGDDGTRRTPATLKYVNSYLENLPAPCDWIYLNNFKQPNKPSHYKFPAGVGPLFSKELSHTIQKIQETLLTSFSDPSFVKKIKKEEERVANSVQASIDEVRKIAVSAKLDLQRTQEGSIMVVANRENELSPVEDLSIEELEKLDPLLKKIQSGLSNINDFALSESEKLMDHLDELRREKAQSIIDPYLKKLERNFPSVMGLKEWLCELEEDILSRLYLFLDLQEEKKPEDTPLENRYSANVMVSNDPNKGPRAIVEPNPTYENLFGSIKYYTTSAGGFETDFTMIRGGSLHQANGGILIVRAEDVASHPHTWRFLKAALRDKEIRIEELHRVSGIPLLAAPEPQAIPLDVQIILVGSPHWYYSFFYTDEEFQNYFKIKSDIESTIAVTEKNLQILGSLLYQECLENLGLECEKDAITYVLSYGCRLANHRKKISARIDVLSDILKEAAVFAKVRKRPTIKQEDVLQALQGRHYRNSRFQDLEQEYLKEDLILIQTQGSAIGQINGLTVQSVGTENFGSPSRITARTYMGRNGIINIEHVVDLSGPLQHKGVLSLEGFLRGVFGQLFPISFSATITFEQNYGGVEGDSASIAELMAILSSLSQIPLRQDIAITGSMNQMGMAQAIGGVNEKIEGFYTTCKRQGLTGTQGVIIPETNRLELVLLPEIAQAVADEKFHIWTIKTVFEAVELLMGMPAGEASFMEESQFNYTIFGKVFQKLRYFDQELHKRYNFSQKEYIS
jgi:hypothetical protein